MRAPIGQMVMNRALLSAVFAAGLILGMSTPARVQEVAPAASIIQLNGQGLTSLQVTPDSLAGLRRIEQDVSFQTSRGLEKGHYAGVLLWDLFKQAGIANLPGHHAELQRTFVVTGKDGYVIAFSVGEIGPDFGNKAIMIADHVDGKPLAPGQGLRLVVPGDARGARSVRNVIKIEVR